MISPRKLSFYLWAAIVLNVGIIALDIGMGQVGLIAANVAAIAIVGMALWIVHHREWFDGQG